ncbi:sensor histidine kinase [Janibacter sp. G1551]|uniref:sensor histidine kinase n=1 Tax=Janibacter sp. G1551 TaxID=3420440 RepID=UPI003CFDAC89
MTGAFHLPTALAVAAFALVLALAWWLVNKARAQRRGFLSATDRATYETLHSASVAGRHLAEGLTDDGCERAAPHLRAMLDVGAVALCDPTALIVWDGIGDHHASTVLASARASLETGATVVLRADDVRCGLPECEIRAAVITPLVADDLVIGALAAYGREASAGLARATEEVAAWVSAQVELADLGRERTRAMEAELRALRAQISPHFIYNSLAAIASFVRTDPDRARELLLEFADFTRYALRRGGAFTTLSEELRNVERYLVLEQARFGERLKISLLVAPEVLSVTLPYLAIQPLVENAVRHGLAAKEGPGTVTITASDRGGYAEISIEDDGVGADPEVIRKVLDDQHEGDSIGLGNVDSRLRQLYGDDVGLVVETGPQAGMKVTFRIPKFSAAAQATD